MKYRVFICLLLLKIGMMHAFEQDQSRMIAGIIYSGDIKADHLKLALEPFKNNFDVQTRAIYSFDTIDTPGFYELAGNVSNQITISVSNVTLDMHGHTVSGGTNGIVINSGLNNITIKNGIINSVTADGVQVNAGCQDITLKDITVKNGVQGINFEQVTNGLIRNCDMNLNTIGLELDASHNIMIENCTANANIQGAYCLLTSTTCSFIDCKAISTGNDNAISFGDKSNVFGFVSREGYGNIFERCIANSTQNLTATAWDTVIAGFALIGTGTQCNKIINCEAGNSTSSPGGLTKPMGIFIESRMQALRSLTDINSGADTADVRPAWSPDGKYFIVNSFNPDTVQVYEWDRQTETATKLDSVSVANDPAEAAWSPDGQFILVAVGSGASAISVFEFDPINNKLSLVQELTDSDGQTAAAWHPSGRFFATADTGTGPPTSIFEFDRVARRFDLVDTEGTPSAVRALNWHPNGKFLAIGQSTTPSPQIYVYTFDEATKTLLPSPITASFTTGSGSGVFYLKFSPDGNYLAVLKDDSSVPNTLVFSFDGTSLTLVDSIGTGNTSLGQLDWSPDSKFIAVGGAGLTDITAVYSFDPGLAGSALQEVTTFDHNADVRGLGWSPDGEYILISGAPSSTITSRVLPGLSYVSSNVICNNKVYCNSNGSDGIGINGSSISNLIIGNTSFDNVQNYVSVTNVFNQLFGQGPSLLQNSEIGSNDPIKTPMDIPTRIKRTMLLLESLIDNLL